MSGRARRPGPRHRPRRGGGGVPRCRGGDVSAEPVTRVAFIGLGHMGGHMCRNLITAGFSVSAYDSDPEALARSAADGARAAES
ncbi:MAG: NAD(P)-binding domain-containing protein, partial [Solirubrobacteraceae bacterium]